MLGGVWCTKDNCLFPVSYGFVYKLMLTDRDGLHNRFQLGVLHTSSTNDVRTLEVSHIIGFDIEVTYILVLVTWCISR